MTTTTIRLPRAATPEFPDRCVVCGRERPGDVLGLAVARVPPWSLGVFGPHTTQCEVPACAACRDAALRQRRARMLVLLPILVVPIPFAMWWVQAWGLASGWSRVATIALCMVPLLPWMLWVARHPVPFHPTLGRTTIGYAFADREYALEFARRNGAPVP